MTKPAIRVPVRLRRDCEDLGIPGYATVGASGVDLRAAVLGETTLAPGERLAVSTGLFVELPQNLEAQVRSRSGLALKTGVVVLNSPGTIDSDYRGEIYVILMNHGEENFTIRRGDRIAQLVFCPVICVQLVEGGEHSQTDRGESGLGATGI